VEAPDWVAEGRGLDGAERARLARLPVGPARQRLLRGRGLLRGALGLLLGVAPAAVGLQVAPGGRPALVGGGPAFNLSHSGRWLAVAVAAPRPGGPAAAVGVDVEHGPVAPGELRERFTDDVLGRVFTPAEQEAVHSASDPGAAALRLWTRKEAALKAVGAGLRLSAAAVELLVDPPRWGPGLRALDGRWRLVERPLPDGGRCCAALRWGSPPA
jgi:phosphopantetheinyl transferase